MLKRISEMNQNLDDLGTEYKRIEYLFSENMCICYEDRTHSWDFTLKYFEGRTPTHTLQEVFEILFGSWHLRGKFISVTDMRTVLGITKEQLSEQVTTDSFLHFIQIILNAAVHIRKSERDVGPFTAVDHIRDSCMRILNSLGYKLEYTDDTNEFYIVSAHDVAVAVEEAFPDVAHKVRQYRRVDLKGNLESKAEILCTLYKDLEDIQPQMNARPFCKTMCTDATSIFNDLGIRHNKSNQPHVQERVLRMDAPERETWHDRAYDLYLACKVVSSYLAILPEIKKLRAQQQPG